VVSLYLIPIKSISDAQNFNVNSLSLSKVMYFSILWFMMIYPINSSTNYSAVIFMVTGIRCIYFISLSMTTIR
jgi:hypothetical protein